MNTRSAIGRDLALPDSVLVRDPRLVARPGVETGRSRAPGNRIPAGLPAGRSRAGRVVAEGDSRKLPIRTAASRSLRPGISRGLSRPALVCGRRGLVEFQRKGARTRRRNNGRKLEEMRELGKRHP
jgi:hypothetical protein